MYAKQKIPQPFCFYESTQTLHIPVAQKSHTPVILSNYDKKSAMETLLIFILLYYMVYQKKVPS